MGIDDLEKVLAAQHEFGTAIQQVDSIEEMRQRDAVQIAHWAGPVSADVAVSEVVLDGVPALSIVPPGADERLVLVYLHGGGFVLGSPRSYAAPVARMAARAGASAIAVDYRLAPESPWPASLDDTLTVYRHVLDRVGDPGRMGLIGESAGGALALLAMTTARDAGLPVPAFCVPISPLVDFQARGDSWQANEGRDGFVTRDAVLRLVDMLFAGQDPSHASPIDCRLSGLPPLLVQVGEREVLRDDVIAFAEKAQREGVDVALEVWDSMVHLWHNFADLPEGGQALDRIGDFARAQLRCTPE